MPIINGSIRDPPYPENSNAYNDNITSKTVYPKAHDKENIHNLLLNSINILSGKGISYLVLYISNNINLIHLPRELFRIDNFSNVSEKDVVEFAFEKIS